MTKPFLFVAQYKKQFKHSFYIYGSSPNIPMFDDFNNGVDVYDWGLVFLMIDNAY